MSRPPRDNLPDDPAALKAIVLAMRDQRDEAARQHDEVSRRHDDLSCRHDEARRTIQSLEAKERQLEAKERQLEARARELEVEKLRLEMALLRFKKWYYGPRGDDLKHHTDVAQLLLAFATDLEARPLDPLDLPATDPLSAAPQAAAIDPTSVRRVRKGRRDLAAFENLPLTRRVHDLSEDQKPCPCCGEARQKIGEESSWQVEYIPGHFERLEHVRIKYACRRCEQDAASPQIILADKPQQPIDKGMAGPGLLAYVVTSKFTDFLPLYRLENIFARNGFEIGRATQSVWCGDAADLVRPLYDLMVGRVLASHVVATDDTVMPMLAPGKTRQARMWVYVGDVHHPYNVFHFTNGRGRDGPVSFLRDYKQVLLADAYGGYDGVVVGNDITRAGCWAHARRKFVDAEKAHPAIAAEAVALIRRLYAIEDRAKAMGGQARLTLRQQESAPLLAAFKDRLFAWREQVLPKHPMAQAIGYTLNQWLELNVFAADGAVPIDNNVSEREMKRIVLNRKNSLFVGNERGGRTFAILSSLTSTCRRHDVDPQRYLTQLLTNLPATPMSQLDQWLPDRWKLNQAATAV
jgi:transposase